jgi:hypothetical protein
LALNFEEWFLRERFMASAPFRRHYRRNDRAVHPLIPARFFVQESVATSILATAQAASRLTPNGGVIIASDVPDFPVQGL